MNRRNADMRAKFKRKMCDTIFSVLMGVAISIFPPCFIIRSSNASEVREEAPVAFGGFNETWRLEWVNKPQEACGPKDERSETCPCAGFAYAEYGRADLVRIRAGKEIDRFHLTSLFAGQEKPVDDTAAVIQRWKVDDDADFFSKTPPSAESIRKRPSVKIMNVADYNHDGSASEFVLQVGASPCGHRQAVLVGITRESPALRVFGTVRSPNKPLVLEPWAWELLRKNPHHVRYVSWKCGDHAMDQQTELVLSIENNGIRAIQETFECTATDKKGKRVGRTEL